MASLADLLAGQPGIRLDARFSARGRGRPSSISTVRADGKIGALIGRALAAKPIPVAIVSETGETLILSAGESGVIWTQGESTPEQEAAVEVVGNALAILGGLSLTGVVGSGSASKKPKKKPTESVADLDPILDPALDPALDDLEAEKPLNLDTDFDPKEQ